MLILNRSRFEVSASRPAPLAANHGVTESGLALIWATGADGNGAVKVGTGGSSTEIFAGFALTAEGYPTKLVGVYTFTGTGSAVATVTTLSNYINATAIVLDSTGATVSGGLTPQVTVNSSGVVASTAANVNGMVYTVIYSYTPDTPTLVRLFGEFPRQSPTDVGARVGLAKEGSFAITNFDSSVAYAIGDKNCTLGAGGYITKGGSGTVLVDYVVTGLPSTSTPYLTLTRIN